MSHYVVLKQIITDQSLHGGGPKSLVENQTSEEKTLDGFPWMASN